MKQDPASPPRSSRVSVSFLAGSAGLWQIDQICAERGDGLPAATHLSVVESGLAGVPAPANDATWVLQGVTSNLRYTQRAEVAALAARQEGLGRPVATRAALICICKCEAWWMLAQDDRRTILEETSHHISIGLEYLPAIARRLIHSRDLGGPFDFLTWFEFAPEHDGLFNELVKRLRATEEWKYVDREVDVRLSHAAAPPAPPR